MNPLEILKSIASAIRGNYLDLFVVSAIVIAIIVFLVIQLSGPDKAERKMNRKIIDFIKERRNLEDYEMDALLYIIRYEKIIPEYSILLEKQVFEKFEGGISGYFAERTELSQTERAELVERIKKKLFPKAKENNK